MEVLITSTVCLLTLIHSSTAESHGQPGDLCEMEGGVKGNCEDIFHCLETGGVIRREGRIKVCSQDGFNIYVCCRRPHLVARELCDAWSHYWRLEDGRCSIHHPLIYGGEEANLGEFPHAVLVGKGYRQSRINYDCGGTLISPYFVLTAAHCLAIATEGVTIWAKLGEHNLDHDSTQETIPQLKGPMPSALYGAEELTSESEDNVTSRVPGEQEIEVESVFIYPDYVYHKSSYHDIALMKLKHPAKFTARVLPACLPNEFPASGYVGQKLTVVGWGRTAFSGKMSPTLQKVDVTVIDRLTCSLTKANGVTTPKGITEDMICAGDLMKDSCSGDSGGPLSIQSPASSSSCEHTVVGVVSFGVGRGRSPCGLLGVYTRVSSYLDWITGYIAPHGTGYTQQWDNDTIYGDNSQEFDSDQNITEDPQITKPSSADEDAILMGTEPVPGDMSKSDLVEGELSPTSEISIGDQEILPFMKINEEEVYIWFDPQKDLNEK